MTYDTNQPTHKVVNQVVRRLEEYLFDTDIKVKFGDQGRAIIEELIEQYNAEASKQYDEIGHLSIENQKLKRELDETSSTLKYIQKRLSDLGIDF